MGVDYKNVIIYLISTSKHKTHTIQQRKINKGKQVQQVQMSRDDYRLRGTRRSNPFMNIMNFYFMY